MPKITFERDMEKGIDTYNVNSVILPKIEFNFKNVSDEERNQDHTGQRFLCVAALACYINTFANSLKRNGAEVKYIKASADTEKEKDHAMRTRYSVLILDVEIGMEEKYRDIYKKVEENMLDGSLLTYSLEAGMEVEYNLSMVAVD